ncbi:hypothetical protein TIFTF001_008728 [Ficus carica]|uniref:Uncharacterized protein n=1 Tax=Ficus carica TaxID=3494 RepID=A0AA87ZLX9_FICCA|nr:hypothetical protein TIFTF001_008728 [Ficus carica]
MSRPWVLVCLLLVIVFTSQFEWKQQYGNEIEIILSQEKNIQKLNELVRSLRQQLLQCRGENEVDNGTSTPLTELLTELEKPPLLED